MRNDDPFAFLGTGGELRALIRAYDWLHSPLGPVEEWPPTLRTAAALMLASNVPMVMLWGPEGIMLYNDAHAPFAGDRHPALLGSRVLEGWAEVAAFNANVMNIVMNGGTLEYKNQELTLHRRGTPEQVFMNLDYSPVLDEAGEPAGVLAVVVETTETVALQRARGAAEAAVRAERDRAQGVLDNMGEAFVLLDRDFRIVDMNAEAMKMEPRPREQILGRNHWEAYPTVDPALGALYRKAMRERSPASLRHNYVWPDGRDTWIDMRAYPVSDGLAVFYRDITAERRDQSQQSREHAERAAILGQLAEGVIVTDPAGHITFVNDAAERLHGVKLLGVAPDEYVEAYHLLTEAGEPHPPAELPLARAVGGGETVIDARWRIARPDGTEVDAIGSARPIVADGGHQIGAVLTVRDDTERHRAEQALREETQALDTLNRTGTALAGELDMERLVQRVSDAGVALTGAQFGAYFHNVMDETGERLHLYTLSGADRAAFEGMGHPRATPIFGPTFRNEGVIRSDDILVDPRYGQNAPHRGMPHGHLPVRSYMAVSVVSRSGEVLGGLLFGHPEPGRFQARHERLIVGLAAQAAIAIDNARLFQALQEARDTLEQRVAERTAELTEAHEALRQAQKMEAVGQLTGGIAHDFNNLLTGVIGSLDLLQRKMAAGRMNDIDRHVTAATTSANRAAALTHRLLAFSRRQPLDPKPVNANRLVTSMEELLRRTIGESIQLEMVTAGGLWQTRCDPHQVESALLNLAINARDAMPGGGKLTVETCNAHLDSAYAARSREVRPGQYVCICVSDTGTGMDKDTIAKAFEPFFTTKPIGQGTGLGLSMIYGFARQSDGYAKIYSEVGEGTTFKLYLPRHYGNGEVEEEIRDPDTVAHVAEDGEVVLVVEDETAVRDLVTEVLTDMGYRTIEAADGPSGLAILQSTQRIDLLVTDVGLPGLNGRQLADAARVARPDLRILFMTGYAENAAVSGGFLEPGMELITKPFAIEGLVQKLRAMTGGPAG